MKWNQLPAGDVKHFEDGFWSDLGNDANSLITRFKHEKLFRRHLVMLARNGVYPYTHQDVALHLLGKHRCITWQSMFGRCAFTPMSDIYTALREDRALDYVPWSPETFMPSLDQNNILFPVFPLDWLHERHKTMFDLRDSVDVPEVLYTSKDVSTTGWVYMSQHPISFASDKARYPIKDNRRRNTVVTCKQMCYRYFFEIVSGRYPDDTVYATSTVLEDGKTVIVWYKSHKIHVDAVDMATEEVGKYKTFLVEYPQG